MIHALKSEAINASEKGKASPHFTVNVLIGDAADPQIIAEDVKGAALAIDAARAYAEGTSPFAAAEVFGMRDDTGKPTDKERVLRRMLNGGSLTLKVGDVTFWGTFTGYSAAR